MTDEPATALIERTRRGIIRRQRLRDLVLALLWGLSAATAALLVVTLVGGTLWWVGGGAGVGVAIGAGCRWPLGRADALAAGEYLDNRFDLAERMSAVAGLAKSTSRFRAVLLADAQAAFQRGASSSRIFPRWLPQEAQYLAAPIGLMAVCLLLGGEISSRENAPLINPVAVAPNAVTVAPTKKSARAEALAAALKKALERAQASHQPADRAEAARLLAALQRELDLLNAGQNGAKSSAERPGSAGEEAGATDDGRDSGVRAKVLHLAATRAAAALKTLTTRNEKQFQAQAPDWQAYTVWEESLPPARQAGVRAYLNAIAATP